MVAIQSIKTLQDITKLYTEFEVVLLYFVVYKIIIIIITIIIIMHVQKNI